MRDLEGVSQASCDSCLIPVTRGEGGVNARRPRSCLFGHAMLNTQSVMSKRDEGWRLCFKGRLRGPACMQRVLGRGLPVTSYKQRGSAPCLRGSDQA